MMRIRDPKVPIKPIDKSVVGINLEAALDPLKYNRTPDFGYIEENKLEFKNTKRGWELIAQILKPKEQQVKFWKLVERLQEVKDKYKKFVQKQKDLHKKKRRHAFNQFGLINNPNESAKSVNNTSLKIRETSQPSRTSSRKQKNKVVFEDQVQSEATILNTSISITKSNTQFLSPKKTRIIPKINADISNQITKNQQNNSRQLEQIISQENSDDSDIQFESPKIQEIKCNIQNLKKQSTKFMDDYTSIKKEIFKQPQYTAKRRTSNLNDAIQVQEAEHDKQVEEKQKQQTDKSKKIQKAVTQMFNKNQLDEIFKENELFQDMPSNQYKLGFNPDLKLNPDQQMDCLVSKLTMDLKKKTEEIIYENQIMLFKNKSNLGNKKRRQTQIFQINDFPKFKADLRRIESEENDSLKTDEESLSSPRANSRSKNQKRLSSEFNVNIQSRLKSPSQLEREKQQELEEKEKQRQQAIDEQRMRELEYQKRRQSQQNSVRQKYNRRFTVIQMNKDRLLSEQKSQTPNNISIVTTAEEASTKMHTSLNKSQLLENKPLNIQILRPKINQEDQIIAFQLRQNKAKQRRKDPSFESQLRSHNNSLFDEKNIQSGSTLLVTSQFSLPTTRYKSQNN
ncbi:UNKNOWN [Stylonychia lemnae]|uniref:Uncharacterized protein n=1 Tax=Stylonychia lemnae TaxID=5949 RepID=A0A078ALD8_STYLE|nr:UNKNOWN [Stylonychia lemnae]|eukprot:CDW83029.1 UNKNOWN [Stylonychia lemnae]